MHSVGFGVTKWYISRFARANMRVLLNDAYEKWNTFHFHTVKSAAMGGVWVIELLTATNCQSGWAERGTFVASALVALSVLTFIQQKNTCRLSVCGREASPKVVSTRERATI
ncbi:hypothetical protein T09_254 [Trichinella sp. T9]|nr:hypothetical protein T09_254 [Trichinella sp. T9]KRZ90318.1 hypothetical protein T08_15636 [Trichinella sp. T8]